MRRADRLFRLIQLLRHDRVTTARDLAMELEVSERTIYRDVQDLSLSGVPIQGEAGVGYRLMRGFSLPPLMFDEEELAALLLGVRMVRAWTDKGLARGAGQVLAKVEAVLPDRLRPELERNDVFVPAFDTSPETGEALRLLRTAIRERSKIRFDYRRLDDESSQRTVWPLGLAFWGRDWTLAGWCELRQAFRNFRVDRMDELLRQEECFEETQGRTLQDYIAAQGEDTES